MIKKKIKSLFSEFQHQHHLKSIYRFYSRQSAKYAKMQGYENKPADGENDWLEFWHQMNDNVEVSTYRFFSHYMDNPLLIVPESIGRLIIEEKLNPHRFRDYYEDKNMFPKILGAENLPTTVACRINGGRLLGPNYNPTSLKCLLNGIETEKLILKPSLDSDSGRGVMLFINSGNGIFKSVDDGILLSEDFLYSYNDNFVLQYAVRQHKDLAYFCHTSVNTLRIAVYKSVIDEKAEVTASIMRIGKDGSYVDNAHAGGVFIGIDVKTGEVGKCAFDQYGNKYNTWNGIIFSEQQRFIPYWDEVKKFACKMADKIYHHHLIAFDVTLDEEGRPMLIEYNLGGFSYWLFQYTNQPALGDHLNEIIEYCKNKL